VIDKIFLLAVGLLCWGTSIMAELPIMAHVLSAIVVLLSLLWLILGEPVAEQQNVERRAVADITGNRLRFYENPVLWLISIVATVLIGLWLDIMCEDVLHCLADTTPGRWLSAMLALVFAFELTGLVVSIGKAWRK
jgi:magnesium-transporting ATPase (P-type)